MATTVCYDDDSGSKSCSDATSYDLNMTEEEAMAIWLRRNEEIGERVRRREAARKAREERQQPMSSLSLSSSAGLQENNCDERLNVHRENITSGDTNSGFQHAAAVTNSDAWIRATSRNAMGEYDPTNIDPVYQNAYQAYQRFVDTNQAGLADNFIASTPGLAALMEQRQLLMARQRHLDLQLQQINQQLQTSSSQKDDYDKSGSKIRSPNTPHLHQNLKTDDENMIRDDPQPSFSLLPHTSKSFINEAMFRTANSAGLADGNIDDPSNAHSAQKPAENSALKLASIEETSYFYTFEYPNKQDSKEVTCLYCQARVYINPLAVNMSCKSCGHISRIQEESR